MTATRIAICKNLTNVTLDLDQARYALEGSNFGGAIDAIETAISVLQTQIRTIVRLDLEGQA